MDILDRGTISYHIVTGECEDAIRKYITSGNNTDGVDNIIESAKAQAVLMLWYNLTRKGNIAQEVVEADLQRLYELTLGSESGETL